MHPFSIPSKQGVEKECIGNEWVNHSKVTMYIFEQIYLSFDAVARILLKLPTYIVKAM